MIDKETYSRREFILKSGFAGSVLLVGGALAWSSCEQKKTVDEKKPDAVANVDPCDDLSGVSENDISLRQKLGYVKESPIADNQCNNCNLFLPPGEGKACGTCMLFKGPVYAAGYCTYWAPKI